MKSPFDLWKSFIYDDLIELMPEKTLLYGRQEKNNISFDLTVGELLRFFLRFLLGYEEVASEQMFWSNQPDLCVPIVSEALSLRCFLQIKGSASI